MMGCTSVFLMYVKHVGLAVDAGRLVMMDLIPASLFYYNPLQQRSSSRAKNIHNQKRHHQLMNMLHRQYLPNRTNLA